LWHWVILTGPDCISKKRGGGGGGHLGGKKGYATGNGFRRISGCASMKVGGEKIP